jgi:hypothetical protein
MTHATAKAHVAFQSFSAAELMRKSQHSLFCGLCRVMSAHVGMRGSHVRPRNTHTCSTYTQVCEKGVVFTNSLFHCMLCMQVRQELARARAELEAMGVATSEGKLCATPFGIDVVGITEAIALTGALVGGTWTRATPAQLSAQAQKAWTVWPAAMG